MARFFAALGVLIIVFLSIYIYLVWHNKKSMFLEATDKVKIAYDLYPAKGSTPTTPKGYLVLVHMMPATKESWKNFAAAAQTANYTSIAIDLRGHGDSEGGPNGYQSFTDTQHQKSILDLEAAVKFLQTKGATPANTYCIGASIGANLCLQYLAEHPEVKKAVLLSAGLNYRGIKTAPLYKKLKSDQKILAATSRDDGSNAPENEQLFGSNFKNLIIYDRGGHGTNMLVSHPDLTERILNFLAD